jgi:beta-N-acetylhexosaminidase
LQFFALRAIKLRFLTVAVAKLKFCNSLVLCAFFSTALFAENPAALRAARALDNRALAAQVLLTGIDGKGALRADMAALLRAVPAGGVMLFRYNLSTPRGEIAPFLNTVSGAASLPPVAGLPPLPPLIAVDHEGGGVHRFGEGITRLPAPLSAYTGVESGAWSREEALRGIEESAFRSGKELRELGITVNLAPVAEVLSPENRAFLGSRSYGPDAGFVEEAAGAFIRGMERAGVLCVVKHFPGNAGGDPHEEAVSITLDRAALDRLVRPMIALLCASPPPLVMVSHARIPARDAERSASLSAAVVSRWLRGEIGFSGVVIADDFSMAGSTEPDTGRAVVAALNAGVDMVMCWPGNLAATHQAILDALADGTLSRERLVEAASRIIAVKIRAGLFPVPGGADDAGGRVR